MYSTASCHLGHLYVATMVCILFGENILGHLKLEQTPIIHKALGGYVFNWETILSDTFLKQIVDGTTPPFFFSIYITDVIFFHTFFPKVGWEWTISSPQQVHPYHSNLWEENINDYCYEISHYVMIPLHEEFFGHVPPRIFDEVIDGLNGIKDRCIKRKLSHISKSMVVYILLILYT